MPGTLTNPSLPYYIEPKLLFVSDPQVDVQAITEATNAGIPVISISNTDNVTSNVDLIIPAATYWGINGTDQNTPMRGQVLKTILVNSSIFCIRDYRKIQTQISRRRCRTRGGILGYGRAYIKVSQCYDYRG